MKNPMEECPPDEPLFGFTLRFAREENGVWSCFCPEWKCELHDKNLTRLASLLVAEIDKHNEECGLTEAELKTLYRKRFGEYPPLEALLLKQALLERELAEARKREKNRRHMHACQSNYPTP